MTNPINRQDPALRVDALVHEVLSEAASIRQPSVPDATRYDVRLDDSRPRMSDRGGDTVENVHRAATVIEYIHGAADLSAAFAGLAETGLAITGLAATAPVVATGTLLTGAASQFRRGDVQQQQLQYDRMCGVLAALEQRSDSPEVVERAAHNTAFAAGLEDAYLAPYSVFAAAQAAVFRSRDEGHTAVALGYDHGRAFERRYHADLAFHHAVDHARRARAEGRPEWDAIHARAESQRALLDRGASGVAVRP